jgi:hypothetical protein
MKGIMGMIMGGEVRRKVGIILGLIRGLLLSEGEVRELGNYRN